jgi:hypothetical protein
MLPYLQHEAVKQAVLRRLHQADLLQLGRRHHLQGLRIELLHRHLERMRLLWFRRLPKARLVQSSFLQTCLGHHFLE